MFCLQIIGLPTIGFQMDQPDDLHAIAHEMRILTSVVLKTTTIALEQRLSTQGTPLSSLQFGLLRLLSWETFTISELSRKMMLDPSTLVPVVDTLERKGYIRRERDPNDRRRVPLRLTDDGKILLEQLHVVNDDDPMYQALMTMPVADVETLRNILRGLISRLPHGDLMLHEIEERVRLHHNNS